MLHRPYDRKWDAPGVHAVLGEGESLQWLRLDLANLVAGAPPVTVGHPTDEMAIVVLTGVLSLSIGDQHWEAVGGRQSVFDGPGWTIYLPSGTSAVVEAKSPRVELALGRAPGGGQYHSPDVVGPGQVEVLSRGQDHWKRQVRNILTLDRGPQVNALVLGETIHAAGEWSGYPPHKHDAKRPGETVFEEVYYYRLDPEDGFAIQAHYGAPGFPDQGYLVHNRDSFAIPRGYHPVVAQGGYRLYYLWFMAGPSGRRLEPYEDPRYRWVNESPST